jgi:hypothetical protein
MRSSVGAQIKFGPNAIIDNRHGVSKLAPEEWYDQGIFTDGDNARYGWLWATNAEGHGVISAPNVHTGWNPYSKAERAGSILPVKIAAVDAIALAFQVQRLTATTGCNLAADVWIQPDPEQIGMPSISGELMIWFASRGYLPDASIQTLGAFNFGLWSGEIRRGDWHSFPTWIFCVSGAERLSGIFPIHRAIATLQAKGEINPEHYVSSVQLMTEITGGSGICILNQFAVEVRRKA